ncbi:MAG: hypothetical protein IIB54_11025 [Planctomycetes bacterium]|nr:hypothetical protein [Planctomycetota bacterium]
MKLLPKKRESWKFVETYDEDWWGYQGYFTNIEDVDHFLKGLRGDVVS